MFTGEQKRSILNLYATFKGIPIHDLYEGKFSLFEVSNTFLSCNNSTAYLYKFDDNDWRSHLTVFPPPNINT